ncbi:MAG: hypothetical protein C4524_05330 [Candidatus Zixiibacteriota bacterium]|nr:MAG: hypothetical protein C4524_05330 [candidate division Zixibacteria bacterium]
MPVRILDPGSREAFAGPLGRLATQTGNFNTRRTGRRIKEFGLYQVLINLSWPRFLGLILAGYLGINLLFAGLYLLLGVENLLGSRVDTFLHSFLDAYFFSTFTLTLVGYGNLAPQGPWVNAAAALEALAGWVGFALITGMVFRRFARPATRIQFSPCAVIAPRGGGANLQIRLVNPHNDVLLDLRAEVLLRWTEPRDGGTDQQCHSLALEQSTLDLFPAPWTIVHPLDATSPLHGKSPADLARAQAEIVVVIRGFDQTYSQFMSAVFSYRYDEIVWGARFVPACHADRKGRLVVNLRRLGKTEPAPPEVQAGK